MLLQLILAILIGVSAGTITGIIPGIHINLVGVIIISILVSYQTNNTILLLIFIIAMAITHSFVDFIPSILLGAPDEDTVLSILPGHQLLKKGHGYQAILLTIYGSLGGIFIILLITPVFLFLLPKIQDTLTIAIPYILILASILLILKEENKTSATIVFILSGFLGIVVLNSNVNQPFLPMLSGLFGVSSLIISIKAKTKIPKQIIKKPILNKKQFLKPLIASAIVSPFCCLLPGLGSGQSAVIASTIIKPDKKNFLILLGSINTIVLGLSFIIYYIIGKARTGIASTIPNIIPKLTTNHLIIILATIFLTGIICFYYTIFLSTIFIKKIHQVNYTILSSLILLIISLITLYFTNFLGFFILIISTATGIFGILSNVKRINLMGCLVIPVVLNYLI